MKKTLVIFLTSILVVFELTGCTNPFVKTCKEPDCEETEIYKDGYCKKHYFINAGVNALEEVGDFFFN